MAQVKLEVGHDLGQVAAGERLERLLASKTSGNDWLKDATFTRRGERFEFRAKVKGFDVVGEMQAMDETVMVLVSLPWVIRPFRESAGRYIRDLLETNLG